MCKRRVLRGRVAKSTQGKNHETFKDIKVVFSPLEFLTIRSAFSEIKCCCEDDDFDPAKHGYTKEQIETGDVPSCEFEAEVWDCLDAFKLKGRKYVTTGTNYIQLCNLLHTALFYYMKTLWDIDYPSSNCRDCDDAEDLSCIADAVSVVMRNHAYYECKHLSRKLE